MACGCSNRSTASASAATAGTYRVIVAGRQVYESSSEEAAVSVADRFDDATVIPPGEQVSA